MPVNGVFGVELRVLAEGEVNVPCCGRAITENFSVSPGIGSVPVRVIVTGVPALVEMVLLSAVGGLFCTALTVMVTVAVLLCTPSSTLTLIVTMLVILLVAIVDLLAV